MNVFEYGFSGYIYIYIYIYPTEAILQSVIYLISGRYWVITTC